MLTTGLAENSLFKLLKDRNTQDAQAYAGLLLLTESGARQSLENIRAVFPSFTDHGLGHSLRLLERIFQILSPSLQKELSEPELFCLIMAALFHDMGMARSGTEDPEDLREHHAEYAGEPLRDFMAARLTLIPEWRRLYNCILFVCRAHGMERSELYAAPSDADKTDCIGTGVLHFGLLAALLRVGDLLDLDENRTDPFLRDLNPACFQDGETRLHHLRHEHVLRFHPSPEGIEIEVLADSVEEYRLWEWWLQSLEADILQANTRLMPKLGPGLLLPAPRWTIRKAEGADFETEELRFELTEEGPIWNILSQSVYTGEFDFLRELIQNGVDAVLMKDYRTLSIPLPAPSPRSWGMWDRGGRVTAAYSARRAALLVWDTGTGMDLDEVRRFLFRIADSGCRHQRNVRDFPFPAIAKFGIGFISCLSKCREIVLLTQPLSGADGCRVRMFSHSIRAFFERLDPRPVSGTMVSLTLNRSYPAETVLDYLLQTFRYPSVPVEWLNLDEMEAQAEVLRGMGKLNPRPDFPPGGRTSPEDFEKYYEYFDAVRENVYQARMTEANTVKNLTGQLKDSLDEWRRQLRGGSLEPKSFEKELSFLLRSLAPLDRHSDIRQTLVRLLEESRAENHRRFQDNAAEILLRVRDGIDGLLPVQEQLFQTANQLVSPRRHAGYPRLKPLWKYQTCFIPLNKNFQGIQLLTDSAQTAKYRDRAGLFIVQCGFDDWQLGVEWRSLHCFLTNEKELTLHLSDIRELNNQDLDYPVLSLDDLVSFSERQDYDQRDLVEAYLDHLEYSTAGSITLCFSSLDVERKRLLLSNEEQTEQRKADGGWHTLHDEDRQSIDFLRNLSVDLLHYSAEDVIAVEDLSRLQSGFYQDGIALDVDPTALVPLGMCRAQVNLTGAARMELNITRHHIDQARDKTDAWLARVGGLIQDRVLRQLEETLEEWGFSGDLRSLCTKESPFQGGDAYLAEQSLRRMRGL